MSRSALQFGGGRRVELLRQSETSECGLACIAMVANYHGCDMDLSAFRRRYSPGQRGLSLQNVMSIADRVGLVTRAVKLPLEGLRELATPAILHWNMRHFVVLARATKRGVLIHDPAIGTREMEWADVSRHFTGVALEVSPAVDFKPVQERTRLALSSLWGRSAGMLPAMAQVLTVTLLLQALALAAPYYLQIAVDSALPAMDMGLLMLLAIGFGLLGLFNGAMTVLRSFLLLRVGTAISFQISLNLARKLFRLPVSFFETRHVGDVLSRFAAVQPIKDGLTQGIAAGVVDGLFAITTLALMFVYGAGLSAVVVFAFLLYAVVRLVTFRAQRSRREEYIIASSRESSTLIEAIKGIVTLRMLGRESDRLAVWQSRLSEATNAEVSSSKVSAWQTAANALIFSVENVVVVYLAIRSVATGGFSLGMLFAFLAYKQQFIQRGSTLIDNLITMKMLGLYLGRIGDIALEDDDKCFGEGSYGERQIDGAVSLRDVCFKYGTVDPLVLNGVNLSIAAGEHVAITGPSGGGKTTLVKLLLGLADPTGGEVLVDGERLSSVGYANYRRQVSAVLQDDQLFSGSIADNIALFEPEPDQSRIEQAARMAAVHEDVLAMPMRYETLVGEGSAGLSGGQKQRVLLARALYRQPRVLIMDEGTAHLDALTEQRVNRSIAELGITRIVVAHRTETIRNADRVVLLVGGKVIENRAADAEELREKTAGHLQALP